MTKDLRTAVNDRGAIHFFVKPSISKLLEPLPGLAATYRQETAFPTLTGS
jgi:hypothetical protein